MSEFEIFARNFFRAAANFVDQSRKVIEVPLGESNVAVHLNNKDTLSVYIENAFILGHNREIDFTLEIWRSNDRIKLPNLGWAQNYLAQDMLVPTSKTNPYRVAFDKSQGFIYLYDSESKRAAIWIADDSQISLNSFVTPFRVIFSWMAESFGGEIIHASAIAKNGKGLIFNGPSGSGKSTLALLCALEGAAFIADDVLLFHDGTISAIYRYAKVEPNSSPCDLSDFKVFQMDSTKNPKNILDLYQFGSRFITQTKASALILPIFAHLNHHEAISPSIALKLLAPNSLRELMGGTSYNFKNLVHLTRRLPSFRIALSTNTSRNLESIDAIIAELR